MKRTRIQISIPKPCHESWDAMTTTEHGAFCHSCQKEVIDFSTMTDREVIEYLSKARKGCGRFRVDQVEVPLTIVRVDNGFMKWRAFFLGLLPLFAFKTAMASHPAPMATDQNPMLKKDTKSIAPALPPHIAVTGTVVNEKKEKVPSAVIQFVDSSGNIHGTPIVTDKKGCFSITIERSIYKDQLPSLSVYSHYYETKIIQLTNEPLQQYKVKFEKRVYIMGDWPF